MAYTNGTAQLDLYHEERIQKLEDSSKEISVRLEASTIQGEYLSAQIKDLSSLVSKKLDETVVHLGSHLESTNEKLEKATDAIVVVSERVADLEKEKVTRKRHWERVRKVIFAAIAAIAGILATKAVDVWAGK